MREFKNEQITFYCNCAGELHIGGKQDLKSVEELTLPLQKVYETLWTDFLTAPCYIAYVDDKPGLLFMALQDFCAGEMPALLTVSATGFDYDLIPVSEKALSLINDTCFELPDGVRRLLVMLSINDAVKIERRMKNDFVIVVGEDGVTGSYEL